MNKKIKLIIFDLYGVMVRGSYKNTCQWLSRRYGISYDNLYRIVYHKYFSQAALGKITEQQSFELPLKHFKIKDLNWRQLRQKHLSFLILNRPVFNLATRLQKNYKILLLSKNTPYQFNWTLRKHKLRKFFFNIVNTFNLKLPKASKKTLKWVMRKFQVRPEEIFFTDDQKFNLVEPKKLGVHTLHYKSFGQLNKVLISYLKNNP